MSDNNFLESLFNQQCSVFLGSGISYSGKCCSIDSAFNIVLKDVTENIADIEQRSYKTMYIRGNSVIHVGLL